MKWAQQCPLRKKAAKAGFLRRFLHELICKPHVAGAHPSVDKKLRGPFARLIKMRVFIRLRAFIWVLFLPRAAGVGNLAAFYCRAKDVRMGTSCAASDGAVLRIKYFLVNVRPARPSKKMLQYADEGIEFVGENGGRKTGGGS